VSARPFSCALLFGALLAAALVGCSPSSPAPGDGAESRAEPSWPAEAVLGVIGASRVAIEPIEVDRAAAWMLRLYPERVLNARRREALDHLILWRAALAAAFPDERERGLGEARAWLAGALAGEPEPAPTRVEGALSELSLGLWGLAGDLEAGVWTGPHEERGRWLLVRRLPEDPAAPLALEHYALEIFEVSFVPAEADLAEVEAIMDSSELVLLDPSWRETVPARWRYRMNASPGETE